MYQFYNQYEHRWVRLNTYIAYNNAKVQGFLVRRVYVP